MSKEQNPFLTPNYEAALEALTRGPMTSNQHGMLIRPVDQLAEAVRLLHRERESHAAEVVRYRAALDKIMRTPTMPFPDPGAHSQEAFGRAVFDAWSRMSLTARYATVEPPAAAVKAVEEIIHATYEVIGGVRARRAVFPDAPPSKVAIARLDAALAAYEEALRG